VEVPRVMSVPRVSKTANKKTIFGNKRSGWRACFQTCLSFYGSRHAPLSHYFRGFSFIQFPLFLQVITIIVNIFFSGCHEENPYFLILHCSDSAVSASAPWVTIIIIVL
jgi:hypothetical protein